MRRLSLVLLVSALGVFVCGVVRWVTLGARIAEERRAQPASARVILNLSRQEGWRGADYVPRRTGLHSLVLETHGRSSKLESVATFVGYTNENHIHWTALDSFLIAAAGAEPWTIRASVVRGNAKFEGLTSSIILQPPARFDVGSEGFSRGVEAALTVGLGLILLTASAAAFYGARKIFRDR